MVSWNFCYRGWYCSLVDKNFASLNIKDSWNMHARHSAVAKSSYSGKVTENCMLENRPVRAGVIKFYDKEWKSMQLSGHLGLYERTVTNVCSDWNEEKGKKKRTTPLHTSPSEVNLHWTIFISFQVHHVVISEHRELIVWLWDGLHWLNIHTKLCGNCSAVQKTKWTHANHFLLGLVFTC